MGVVKAKYPAPSKWNWGRVHIPYTEYPVMFHGHNERVDTESLKLSAMMWEALCREFLD